MKDEFEKYLWTTFAPYTFNELLRITNLYE